jgi:hypothetical protein
MVEKLGHKQVRLTAAEIGRLRDIEKNAMRENKECKTLHRLFPD